MSVYPQETIPLIFGQIKVAVVLCLRIWKRYQLAKSRYDDPASKMFKNQWYKTTTLDTAWAKYEEVQQELLTKKSAL